MIKRESRARAVARMEQAACGLMNTAEKWTLINVSLWDLKVRREELLTAARKYAAAVAKVRRS